MLAIRGDRGLLQKLDALKRKDFSNATRNAAKILHTAIKDALPRRSGLLRRSVRVRSIKSRKIIGHRVVIKFANAGEKLFYAQWLEFGKRGYPGQHYMERVIKGATPQALDEIKNTLAQIIMG